MTIIFNQNRIRKQHNCYYLTQPSFVDITDQGQKIAALVKSRLAYMKYIAGYKFKNHMLIKNHVQENKVFLHSCNTAELVGLDKKFIEPFIESLINIAKNIQDRYIQDWISAPETIKQYNDLENIRFKISIFNDNLIKLIAKEIQIHGTIQKHIDLYINNICLHNLTAKDKKILCEILKKISLKKSVLNKLTF